MWDKPAPWRRRSQWAPRLAARTAPASHDSLPRSRSNQHARDDVTISEFFGTRRTSDPGGGNSLSPAEALRKHRARTEATPTVATPAIAHMVIVYPLSDGRFVSRGNTHPPAEAQIARLEAMVYGGDTLGAARTLRAPIMLDYQRRGGRINPITPGVTPRDAGRNARTMQQRPGSKGDVLVVMVPPDCRGR